MQHEIIKEIYTDQIHDPKDAMRSELDRDALFELAENIKANGLINPITVRPVAEAYEVVAGHRRLSACKIAGKIKIPCVVRTLDDKQAFEVMAAENLERADVDPVDEAIFVKRFIEQTNESIAEVAKRLKRSIAWVESRLAVGEMPDYMQAALKAKEIKLGVALTLMQITDENTRYMWTFQAARDGVSVAQAEYWLSGWKLNQLPGGDNIDTPPEGFVPGGTKPVLFRCAIDDQQYDVRLMKSVVIAEENYPIFIEFVNAYRSTPGDSVLNSAEN